MTPEAGGDASCRNWSGSSARCRPGVGREGEREGEREGGGEEGRLSDSNNL